MSRERVIYFIADEAKRFVKIGVSINVGYRLFELQAGCPIKLDVWLSLRVGDDLALHYEDALHQQFAEEWIHREWFHVSERLGRYIEAWVTGKHGRLPESPVGSSVALSRRIFGPSGTRDLFLTALKHDRARTLALLSEYGGKL